MPQTISEAMVQGVLGDVTDPTSQEQLPLHLDMMENIPTIPAAMGTKAFRASGTALRGGSGVGMGMNPGATAWGATREGVAQANYLNPRNWNRFGTTDYFHHTGALSSGSPRTTQYNPFWMSSGMNWAGRQFAEGGRMAGGSIAEAMSKRGLLPDIGAGEELVSKGFYSRVSAAGRVGWMSEARVGSNALQHGRFLRDSGFSARGATDLLRQGKTGVRMGYLASGAGTMSGRVGGFMAGALGEMSPRAAGELSRGAKRGYDLARSWQTAGSGARAAGTAGKAATVGKRALLGGARVAGMAVPGLNVALTAWLVYDLAKMGTKGLGRAMNLGADAHRSFIGDMRTGIMEQGFRDTEATMTSRARGVQAIQNSRLNARSILGAEAGAMHGHFG